MNFLITTACFISTLVYNTWNTGDPFREGKLFFFFYAFALYGFYDLSKKYNVFIALTWAWACAMMAIANGTFWAVSTVFISYIFLQLGSFSTKNLAFFEKLLRLFTWTQIVISLLQALDAWPFMWMDYLDIVNRKDVYGTLGQPTILGAFLATVAPLAWYRWSKIECGLLVLLCILCDSSMTLAALIAAFLMGDIKERKYKLAVSLIVLGLAVVIGIYLLQPTAEILNPNGRLNLWRRVVPQLTFFGHGPGSWFGFYPQWQIPGPIWDKMHSDPLQLLFEIGVPGLFFGILGSAYLLLKAKKAEAAMLAAMLVNSLGNFTLHVPVTGFLFCCVMAIISQGSSFEDITHGSSAKEKFQEMVRFFNPYNEWGSQARRRAFVDCKALAQRGFFDIKNEMRRLLY